MAFVLSRAREVSEREEQGTDVLVKNELGEQETYVDERGQTQPSVIVMAGKNSQRYRRKKAEQDRRKLSPKTLTEGKWRDDAMELTVACVIGWRGIESEPGVVLMCSEHNITMVFKAAPWVFDACAEAMDEAASFLKDSSPPPANMSEETHAS